MASREWSRRNGKALKFISSGSNRVLVGVHNRLVYLYSEIWINKSSRHWWMETFCSPIMHQRGKWATDRTVGQMKDYNPDQSTKCLVFEICHSAVLITQKVWVNHVSVHIYAPLIESWPECIVPPVIALLLSRTPRTSSEAEDLAKEVLGNSTRLSYSTQKHEFPKSIAALSYNNSKIAHRRPKGHRISSHSA